MTTIALVTGANRGLGRETVRRLAARGWTVWLGARDPERGATTADELSSGGHDVRYVPLDVTSDESVQAAVKAVDAEHGRLDALVNNAGITGGRVAPAETGPDDFRACYETNVFGPVRVTRAFLPLLRRSDQARVVMVSSGMGSLGITTDPERLESDFVSLVYPSSKTALNMITTQYAKALPDIKVNAADPGYTATDLNAHRGHKSVEQGAEVIVALATVGADGPTGGYFDQDGPLPW
jgi:NAD(P)-dependent dehydrogenase (short-subunit alcohol dehydrogenase family)